MASGNAAREEIVLSLDTLEAYEGGAVLVSVLAYPQDIDESRAQLHRVLCALVLRTFSEGDTGWANTPQLIKPMYATCTDREITKSLRTLERRLRDRMAAGRMAIAFLKEVATGAPPELPKCLKRLSINQLAELVLSDTGQSDVENVETRVWRPSLPVVHLAAATQVLMQGVEREGHRPISIGDLLTNRSIIEWIVRAAQEYEDRLLQSPRLRIKPNTLVKVRLA